MSADSVLGYEGLVNERVRWWRTPGAVALGIAALQFPWFVPHLMVWCMSRMGRPIDLWVDTAFSAAQAAPSLVAFPCAIIAICRRRGALQRVLAAAALLISSLFLCWLASGWWESVVNAAPGESWANF